MKILVTGSEGMIGKELCELLEKQGHEVFRFDFKRIWGEPYTRDWVCYECGTEFKNKPIDVRDYELISEIFDHFKPEAVFHLFGIKGNPKMTKEKPLNFMLPMIQGDSNIIKICVERNIPILYTSSIAVNFPESDKYPAWAKRTGEMLLEASSIQHPEFKYVIVRPSNVYGRYDNFDNPNAMVVTSLISKAIKDKKLILDKKGAFQTRDLINARDVARGMIEAFTLKSGSAVNLCSGKQVNINKLALLIKDNLNIDIEYTDLNLVLGPVSKGLDIDWNFLPEISLEDGIKEVCDFVRK